MGWENGAKEVINMERCNAVDDKEEEIVFLEKTGKYQIYLLTFYLIFENHTIFIRGINDWLNLLGAEF